MVHGDAGAGAGRHRPGRGRRRRGVRDRGREGAITGVPPNPGGWPTTTARNRATDRLRRESTRPAREREAAALSFAVSGAEEALGDRGHLDAVPDDQLRLIFLCCHPALSGDAQVALTLRLLGGLTTAEIARAFLVPQPTMGQRLSRAKRKIRDTHMPYRIPSEGELAARLTPVLTTIYLIFSEGHTATAGETLPGRSSGPKRSGSVGSSPGSCRTRPNQSDSWP